MGLPIVSTLIDLGKDVLDGFMQAIDERERRGESDTPQSDARVLCGQGFGRGAADGFCRSGHQRYLVRAKNHRTVFGCQLPPQLRNVSTPGWCRENLP